MEQNNVNETATLELTEEDKIMIEAAQMSGKIYKAVMNNGTDYAKKFSEVLDKYFILGIYLKDDVDPASALEELKELVLEFEEI